jgi:hypothetical protein
MTKFKLDREELSILVAYIWLVVLATVGISVLIAGALLAWLYIWSPLLMGVSTL